MVCYKLMELDSGMYKYREIQINKIIRFGYNLICKGSTYLSSIHILSLQSNMDFLCLLHKT